MNDNILNITVRLVVAMVLGGIVGLEREYRAKDAGFRTHFLVRDTSRVAAQVVSGIGFLGAGIIVLQRNVIRGLTTAAGLWVTAAIGMACGVGRFYMAVLVTVLMLVGLELLSHFIPHLGASSVHLSFSSPSREKVAEAIEDIRRVVADVVSYEIKNKRTTNGEYYDVRLDVRTSPMIRNNNLLDILKDFDEVTILDEE